MAHRCIRIFLQDLANKADGEYVTHLYFHFTVLLHKRLFRDLGLEIQPRKNHWLASCDQLSQKTCFKAISKLDFHGIASRSHLLKRTKPILCNNKVASSPSPSHRDFWGPTEVPAIWSLWETNPYCMHISELPKAAELPAGEITQCRLCLTSVNAPLKWDQIKLKQLRIKLIMRIKTLGKYGVQYW